VAKAIASASSMPGSQSRMMGVLIAGSCPWQPWNTPKVPNG
jgi:hypothetical protein